MKDENGVDAVSSNTYLYQCVTQGPDTTLVIEMEFKNYKVLCFDLYHEHDIELEPGQLFQRKNIHGPAMKCARC